jgi:hypothetical protein
MGHIYKKYFFLYNLRFKDFRDSLIRNFIQTLSEVTCDQLFKKIKPKKSDMVIPDNAHFQETIPLLQDTKEKNLKTVLYVSKIKIENKLNFSPKCVRLHYELENALKFTTKTKIEEFMCFIGIY